MTFWSGDALELCRNGLTKDALFDVIDFFFIMLFYICLKQGQGMRGRAAPPHPGIY